LKLNQTKTLINNKMKSILIIFILLIFSLNAISQKGEIRGRVTDGNNGEPIGFANVVVYGTQIGSTSDLDGNFIISGLNPGYLKIRVSFIGYKNFISEDILVSNNNIPNIEVKLLSEAQELATFEVRVDPFEKREEAPISMQRIGTKEIESNPGSNRDILRVIQSFPGVGSTPAFRNDVIIRGGGPSENRFFLDDVEIPVLNHFSTQGASGGPVGIINADFISSVDFYSGSFPANKYNALSGVLDFKLKDGSKVKTNIQAALGASETSLTFDGPLGKKSTYIFSVRRSYLQFLFSAIGLPFLPTFNDYQFKINSNINTKNQITIISLGALDNLTLNNGIKNPTESQQYILTQIPINYQWNYTFGIVYKHFFKNGYNTFVLSRNMLDNQFFKYPDNNESLNKSFDYLSKEEENKFQYNITFRKNDIKYLIGANMEFAQYYNSTSQQLYLNDSLINLKYLTSFDMVKYGISAQASKRVLQNKLLISAGIRTDANSYNIEMTKLLSQLSPRISFSYSLAENTLLNAGVGRYFQQPAYTTLGFRNNSGLLTNHETAKYIGANHYSIGLEHRFSTNIILSAESFYKDYFQYPIDLFTGASLANQGADYSGIAGATSADFHGQGKAVGIEVLNRINYKTFTLLASYTFVRSQFTDINKKWIASSWDSKNLISITGTKEFIKNWRLGFKWRYVGGLPYTPYDLKTSAKIVAWAARGQAYQDYSQLNALRFKAFHQLDLRVDKNIFFDKWALMVYVDIQNAYNFQNVNQDYIIREKNGDGTYMTANNGTEYVLKSVENVSGTVLPTLGIMVKF